MAVNIPQVSLQLIEDICSQHDCSLVDYAVRGDSRRVILDLFIDNRTGVTLELCSIISWALRDQTTNDKFLSDAYLLEVSSPGVDRPLKFNWQYEKHVSRLLEVSLSDGSRIRGRLRGVDGTTIELEVQKQKGQTVSQSVSLESVTSARVHLEI